MIVDFHTHIFPPHICDSREECLRLDPVFAALYSHPKTKLATADDLLRSMDEAGVDVSVVVNLGWQDAALCRRTNDYILESAADSGGRLVPFCAVAPNDDGAQAEIERCAASGARGLGELRPESGGNGLHEASHAGVLAWAAQEKGLPLLFHVTEPVGHSYPGKEGQRLESLYRFIEQTPAATVIGAHWGGGLPFYALMPRVHKALANTYFDTAATRFLYQPLVYRQVISLIGAEHILFGSDFPLLPQSKCLHELAEAPLEEEERRLIRGENARRLLNLP